MERDGKQTSWAGVAAMVLGAWLIGSVPIFAMAGGVPPSPPHFWNALVVGTAIIAMGAWGAFFDSAVPYWIEAVLGAWLLAAPIVLRIQDANEGWHTMLVGMLLFALGFLAAATRRSDLNEPAGRTPHRMQ